MMFSVYYCSHATQGRKVPLRHLSKFSLSSFVTCQLRDKEIQFLSALAKTTVLPCNKSKRCILPSLLFYGRFRSISFCFFDPSNHNLQCMTFADCRYQTSYQYLILFPMPRNTARAVRINRLAWVLFKLIWVIFTSTKCYLGLNVVCSLQSANFIL